MKNNFLTLMLCFCSSLVLAQEIYNVSRSNIAFTSDAPLELIEAESTKLQGALDIGKRSFAFRVPMTSFDGFNSSLQRTHFNENYLESSKFPYTIFEGKIIENVDLTKPGTYSVRGKGKFTCHGIKQQRIIKCKVKVTKDKVSINTSFSVFLEDHDIDVPTIVSQKIAEEITVELMCDLKPKN